MYVDITETSRDAVSRAGQGTQGEREGHVPARSRQSSTHVTTERITLYTLSSFAIASQVYGQLFMIWRREVNLTVPLHDLLLHHFILNRPYAPYTTRKKYVTVFEMKYLTDKKRGVTYWQIQTYTRSSVEELAVTISVWRCHFNRRFHRDVYSCIPAGTAVITHSSSSGVPRGVVSGVETPPPPKFWQSWAEFPVPWKIHP
jgi:hypothetical protein